jgi:catechol 2,3-dioxygenase-like lactoylglutathione lyase family enzyme
MKAHLEHANLCVADIEGMTEFLLRVFPDFRVRGEGLDAHRRSWRHVGDDATYLALQEATTSRGSPWVPYSGEPGLNHLGYVVDDVEALMERLDRLGMSPNLVAADHPARKRVYFYDPEGNDWEFVQYYANDPKERNDYAR